MCRVLLSPLLPFPIAPTTPFLPFRYVVCRAFPARLWWLHASLVDGLLLSASSVRCLFGFTRLGATRPCVCSTRRSLHAFDSFLLPFLQRFPLALLSLLLLRAPWGFTTHSSCVVFSPSSLYHHLSFVAPWASISPSCFFAPPEPSPLSLAFLAPLEPSILLPAPPALSSAPPALPSALLARGLRTSLCVLARLLLFVFLGLTIHVLLSSDFTFLF